MKNKRILALLMAMMLVLVILPLGAALADEGAGNSDENGQDGPLFSDENGQEDPVPVVGDGEGDPAKDEQAPAAGAEDQAAKKALKLEVKPAKGGKIVIGNKEYKDGDTVDVTPGQALKVEAAENPGWSFVKWEAVDCGTLADAAERETTCTIQAAYAGGGILRAVFEENETAVEWAVSPAGAGTVTITGAGPYHFGDTFTLTATANEGWVFDHWEDNELAAPEDAAAATTTGRITQVEGGVARFTAVFADEDAPEEGDFLVGFSVRPTGEAGDILLNDKELDSPVFVATPGKAVKIKAVPNEGWAFVGWKVDAPFVTDAIFKDKTKAETTFTIPTGLTEDMYGATIIAEFDTAPVPLPSELYWYDADGTTELDMTADEALATEAGAEAMEYGGETPANKDCHFAFTGFGPLQSKEITETADGVTYTHTKYWRVAQYAAALTHVEKKDPTKTEAGNIEYWHCGTCGKNYSDEKGEHEIEGSVVLEPIPTYAVVTGSNPEQGGTVTGAGSYAAGETVKLTFTPAEGYDLRGWQVESQNAEIGEDLTFVMPAEPVTVIAQWERLLTAVWLDSDGKELDRKTYMEDDPVPTTDKKAAKAADETYTYTFRGWDEGTLEGAVTYYKPVFDQKPIYTVVKGAKASYRLKSGKVHTVTVKRSVADETILDHVTGVKLDKTELQKDKDYTLTKGSAVVSIKASVMNKLKKGSHTITVLFDDGEAETTVKVLAAYDDQTGTGDNSHMFLWLGLTAFGMMGLVVLYTERKRLNER